MRRSASQAPLISRSPIISSTDSDKEGIDVKETSARGRVHHNLVHHLRRQGIYVDAWFGKHRRH